MSSRHFTSSFAGFTLKKQMLYYLIPNIKKHSYFHSVDIDTIPRFITEKKWIFGINLYMKTIVTKGRRKKTPISYGPFRNVLRPPPVRRFLADF